MTRVKGSRLGGPTRVTNRSLVFTVHDESLVCDFERVGGPERAPALTRVILEMYLRSPLARQGGFGQLRSWCPRKKKKEKYMM